MSKVGPKVLKVNPKDTKIANFLPSNWTIGDDGLVDQHFLGKWSDEEEELLEHLLRMVYKREPIIEQGKRAPRKLQHEAVRGRPAWRRVREGEGLTPAQLAEQLDLSPASISRYESGDRWPDSHAYRHWLREADDRQRQEDAEHVFWLLGKREGWHKASPEGISFGEVWDLFNTHIVEPWLQTGQLPHYTPQDHYQPA